MQTIGVGVCLLVVRDKKLLVAERTNEFGKGYLACPGGHQEKSETWEQTANRELVEEVGPSIKIELKPNTYPNIRSESNIPIFVTNNVLSNTTHYVTIWLRAVWLAGEAINAEPSKKKEWVWMTLDEIIDDPRMRLGKEAWIGGTFHDALHWLPLPELYKHRNKLAL